MFVKDNGNSLHMKILSFFIFISHLNDMLEHEEEKSYGGENRRSSGRLYKRVFRKDNALNQLDCLISKITGDLK